MPAVMRQPRPPRGHAARALLAGAAGLAVVPLVLSSLCRPASGPLSFVAHSAPAAFVLGRPGSSDRAALAARAAAKKKKAGEQKPGGPPAWGQVEKPKYKMVGESFDRQSSRVARFTKFYKSVKGRHMPYGPKPWDPPRFKRVEIKVKLEAKQASNTKILNQVIEEVRRVSGVHPKIMKSKINNNELGLRVGDACGVSAIIFGPLMYDFLERFNAIVLPRVRDFEGLPDNVDRRGDFFYEIPDQDSFKELDELIDTRELVHPFQIGIITNRFTNPDGRKLMEDFGFPFSDERKPQVRKVIIETEGERIARKFAEKRAAR